MAEVKVGAVEERKEESEEKKGDVTEAEKVRVLHNAHELTHNSFYAVFHFIFLSQPLARTLMHAHTRTGGKSTAKRAARDSR